MELRELLFNILTINLNVFLWGEDGHLAYEGNRVEALEEFGQCRVTGWRIDGNRFRAKIGRKEAVQDGR